MTFMIDGEPVAMQRPRVTKYGVHYPGKCDTYKKLVSLKAKVAMAGRDVLQGPLAVVITCGFEPPKSWSMVRKLRNEWMMKKPDADNLAKGILDGCNGICWKDDNQIVSLSVLKIYDKNPGVRVDIFRLDDKPSPWWICNSVRSNIAVVAKRNENVD